MKEKREKERESPPIVRGGVSQADIRVGEREVYYISPPQDCVHLPRPQSERVSPQMGEPATNGREKLSLKCVAENEGEKREKMMIG